MDLVPIAILLVFLSYATYYFRSNNRAKDHPISTTSTGVVPDLAVIEGPAEILAGDCFKISVHFKDKQGLPAPSNGASIEVQNAQHLKLTLFSSSTCAVADSPVSTFQIPSELTDADIYSATATLGPLTFRALAADKSAIRTEQSQIPPVAANYKKINFVFSKLPTEITEGKIFGVEVRAMDPFNHPLETFSDEVTLSAEESDSQIKKVINSVKASRGVATFAVAAIEEMSGNQIRLNAKSGNNTASSILIYKKPFVVTRFGIDVEGYQKFAATAVKPLVYQVIKKLFKIDISDGTTQRVTIENKEYVVDSSNPKLIKLKLKTEN